MGRPHEKRILMPLPRIVIADDHTLVVEGLHKLLEDKYELVGTAEDGRTLLTVVQEQKPDVVVVDISMPQLNGLDAARQLLKFAPACKIMFITMHTDVEYAIEAFQAGASAYLLKRSAASEFQFALQAVLKNQFYVTPEVAKGLLLPLYTKAHQSMKTKNILTARQREVLQLVAEGKTVKEIAHILGVSSKTVEFHKTQIMKILNLHSTVELTKYAVAQRIVSTD